MSQTIVTKDAVVQVREKLRAAGKKVTVGALRAALGDHGSLSTILKIKQELDEEELAATDSIEGLQAFRTVWSMALQAGRSRRDEEVQDLRESLSVLEADSQRFEGEALAAKAVAQELGRKLEEAGDRFKSQGDELTQARDATERSTSQLVAAMEDHKRREMESREQLAALLKKNHELELELARVATKLEMATAPSMPVPTPEIKVRRRRRTKALNGTDHPLPEDTQVPQP